MEPPSTSSPSRPAPTGAAHGAAPAGAGHRLSGYGVGHGAYGGHTAGYGAAPPGSPPAPEAVVLERALFEVKKVIVGQERVIERLFVCLLSRGHCLLEGVPGLAKTLAMETLARTVGGTFTRIQFTPDLLPADIVGTRIYRHSSEAFDVELGPVFANFVLADEVNRAPAKVQSALLEVMAERQVSIAGRTYKLPEPFLVLATQNPIESEGVYPLPEAQRDRFLMKVLVDYPAPAEEVEIVQRMGGSPPAAHAVLGPADLVQLQQLARDVYVDRGVVDYAVNLVLATRNPVEYGLPELAPLIEYGASPRASLGLVAAGRAMALLRGRRYVLPQDVFDVAPEILRHRIVLSYEALAQGLVVDQLTARVLGTIPAPRVTPTLEAAVSPERWAPPLQPLGVDRAVPVPTAPSPYATPAPTAASAYAPTAPPPEPAPPPAPAVAPWAPAVEPAAPHTGWSAPPAPAPAVPPTPTGPPARGEAPPSAASAGAPPAPPPSPSTPPAAGGTEPVPFVVPPPSPLLGPPPPPPGSAGPAPAEGRGGTTAPAPPPWPIPAPPVRDADDGDEPDGDDAPGQGRGGAGGWAAGAR